MEHFAVLRPHNQMSGGIGIFPFARGAHSHRGRTSTDRRGLAFGRSGPLHRAISDREYNKEKNPCQDSPGTPTSFLIREALQATLSAIPTNKKLIIREDPP